MIDDLQGVTLDQDHIPPGGTITANLTYQSETGGQVTVWASNGFDVHPEYTSLPGGSGTEVRRFVIQSTGVLPDLCRLKFSFTANSLGATVFVDAPPSAAPTGNAQ